MKPNHYAVVVGIDHYPGMPDSPLQYARNDAIVFYEWLTSPNEGGLPSQNAKLIMTTDAEQASGAKRPLRWEIIDFLTDFHMRVDGLSESQWSESRLYVYLAGHGVAPDHGRGALLFADARPDYNWGDMLDLGACERFYERCRLFNEIVLLGDFCRDVDAGIPDVGELTFGKCYGESRSTRRITGYATSLSQKAGEPENALEALPAITTVPPGSPSKRTARGFFTMAVLEGLRGGAAPHPILGTVDIDRLETYVRRRVYDLPGFQDVDITNSNAKDLVLVRHSQVPTYPVDVLVPEGFAKPIDLLLDSERKIMDRWSPGDPLKWRANLPAANYEAVARHEEYIFKNDGLFKVRGARVVSL